MSTLCVKEIVWRPGDPSDGESIIVTEGFVGPFVYAICHDEDEPGFLTVDVEFVYKESDGTVEFIPLNVIGHASKEDFPDFDAAVAYLQVKAIQHLKAHAASIAEVVH